MICDNICANASLLVTYHIDQHPEIEVIHDTQAWLGLQTLRYSQRLENLKLITDLT
jgi:hypothetical protein